ncbi:carbohydrate ABC transporter permease [Mycoplasmopsis sturni]|uniref:carbohydrate ABC transporter permease n=1 Tax=Mycoplasmopsis sturni TaxID=39047 RepID=UPI00055C1D45|nr:sugar ABC transporter permease [Mycoplasmopsis sturni]
MNLLSNGFLSKLANKSSIAFNWVLNKQKNRRGTLSHSILEKRTNLVVPMLLLAPGFILIAIFVFFPFFKNIANSLFSESNQFTLEAYKNVLTDPYFAVGVRNSFIYGMLTLPMVMIISLVISSVIAKLYRKYARGFWQTVFFMPYVTNAVAISLVFIQVFSPTGLFNNFFGGNTDWLNSGDSYSFNSLLPIVFNGIWSGLAFNILIYTTAMLSVDKNLYRSASIDGCSEFKQFFTVTLPSIKSTINFIMTLAIIGGLKVFPLALYQSQAEKAVQNGASSLMIYIYYATAGSPDFAKSGAASLLLFIIGVTYSSIIRGGIFAVQLTLNILGERNVWVKVKSSTTIRRS